MGDEKKMPTFEISFNLDRCEMFIPNSLTKHKKRIAQSVYIARRHDEAFYSNFPPPLYKYRCRALILGCYCVIYSVLRLPLRLLILPLELNI